LPSEKNIQLEKYLMHYCSFHFRQFTIEVNFSIRMTGCNWKESHLILVHLCCHARFKKFLWYLSISSTRSSDFSDCTQSNLICL